jgi:hypothetical protein
MFSRVTVANVLWEHAHVACMRAASVTHVVVAHIILCIQCSQCEQLLETMLH